MRYGRSVALPEITLHSVVCVSALSLWALVSGHWSAWQAARVEVEQARELAAEKKHPLEERVVDAVVEETEIEATSLADR